MSSTLLVSAACSAVAFVAGGYMLLRQMERHRRFALRVACSRGIAPAPTSGKQQAFDAAWRRFVAALGQVLLRSGLLSARTRTELQQTLASAGLRGPGGLEIFVGTKVALLAGLPLLAMLSLSRIALPFAVTTLLCCAAGATGLLLPDIVVRYRRHRYLSRVEAGLADALDLLVICAQAGLGLTTAITRVAYELQIGGQEMGTELAITAHELELMGDSRVALLAMASRTGIEGLGRLATTLVQSIQYGTPLSQALRTLSTELRQEVLTRFETRAARLGVLLTVPMIVFILPCVFMIVGGPAAVQVLRGGR